MGRLIRFLVGVGIFVIGAGLLIHYGETAFLSLYGEKVDARVTGACRTPRLLLVDRAPRCPAQWDSHRGDLVGADLPAGSVAPARVIAGSAYQRPNDVDQLLGFAGPVVMALGFGAMVARGKAAGSGG
jgi:hypothetical protein